MNVYEFYSMKEWMEYVDTFMVNAVIKVDDNATTVSTPDIQGRRVRELGRWGMCNGSMYGVIKERRSLARLAA